MSEERQLDTTEVVSNAHSVHIRTSARLCALAAEKPPRTALGAAREIGWGRSHVERRRRGRAALGGNTPDSRARGKVGLSAAQVYIEITRLDALIGRLLDAEQQPSGRLFDLRSRPDAASLGSASAPLNLPPAPR
jgi:hypothetical protein